MRLIFSGRSQRIVPEKTCNDRQLRRAGAQPQLRTRPGHTVPARYGFLQTAYAPVHLEAFPENPRIVLSAEPLHFRAPGGNVSAGGTAPPDGTRSRPPFSTVRTGLARRQHVLRPQRNF